MTRESRRALKSKLAAVYQHFEKAALFSAELYPILTQSDPRLGEMIKTIAESALEAQVMITALWEVMWGPPPDEIHPENV